MWVAERSAVRPATDEDAAMASQRSGRFEDRIAARAALLTMIEKEIAGWQSMGMDATKHEGALTTLQKDDGLDSITVGSVRWRIRQF